jgi:formate hydrogenlyase subunit 3/multisubunit Na+/H+ antiporter MnhD subunit
MPLALQALLPLAILCLAAAVVRWRPRYPANGWIAAGATGLAALVALAELLRLAPGEHVDVPYLTTFPYADLLIRLDGLSLAFSTVTLVTAALLMLVRQGDQRDRRDPWVGWLLTSAAACAVILAGNLLLLYIMLQVLTLAWSGAVDETAPRRRRLRLTLQIADIGLLLGAASAIQSVGTSSFSGVPSDTFGVATFWLMLAPVLVRLLALAARPPQQPAFVLFRPAVALLAPAAYVLMRLLALMGGRLPDRPSAVLLFAGAALLALLAVTAALFSPEPARIGAFLLTAQAGIALALSSGAEPLLTVATTWLWLCLIPLAGLVSVNLEATSPARTLSHLQLASLPGSAAFLGIWLGSLALISRGLGLAVVPIALVMIGCLLAALRGLRIPHRLSFDRVTGWGFALLIIAALPLLAIDPLVLPAASTVRLVPSGTISASLLGLNTSLGAWPALPVSLLLLAAAVILPRLTTADLTLRLPARAAPPARRWPSMLWRRAISIDRLPVRWTSLALWGGFVLLLLVALARP